MYSAAGRTSGLNLSPTFGTRPSSAWGSQSSAFPSSLSSGASSQNSSQSRSPLRTTSPVQPTVPPTSPSAIRSPVTQASSSTSVPFWARSSASPTTSSLSSTVSSQTGSPSALQPTSSSSSSSLILPPLEQGVSSQARTPPPWEPQAPYPGYRSPSPTVSPTTYSPRLKGNIQGPMTPPRNVSFNPVLSTSSPMSPNIRVSSPNYTGIPFTPVPVTVRTPTTQSQPSTTTTVTTPKVTTPKEYLASLTSESTSPTISPAGPASPSTGNFNFNVSVGSTSVDSGIIKEFEREIQNGRGFLGPYYKQLTQSGCQNIEGLEIAKVKLAEFVRIYNKFKPLSGKVRSEAEVDLAIILLDGYIKSIEKMLKVMRICYDKFFAEFTQWVVRMRDISKGKKRPANYAELTAKIEKTRQNLERIADTSNKIRERKKEMETDLAGLRLAKSRYFTAATASLVSSSSSAPSVAYASPYMRQLTSLIGAADTDFVYTATEGRPKLREKFRNLIDAKDKATVQKMVDALKIEDYAKKLRAMGYANEAASIMKYSPDASNVNSAKNIYISLAEKKMLRDQLLELGVLETEIATMTNLQLRNYLNQKVAERNAKSSPNSRNLGASTIDQRKNEIIQRRNLRNLDEQTLYQITATIVSKDVADRAMRQINRKDAMIEAIVTKELGLF